MKEEEEQKTVEQQAEKDGAATEVPPTTTPNKDRYLSRMKEENPDMDENDEEARYERANANWDELDGYRKNNQALVDVMGKNKAFGAMLSAAKDGTDPFLWLSKNLGVDITELAQNPDYAKKISEAAQEYQKAQEEGEQKKTEINNNWKATFEALDKAKDELGLSTDEAYQLGSEVLQIISDAQNGIVSVETFKRLRDGGRYDDDVKSAREEGTIAGRNERISEDLRKKNPDGIPPSLPSSGAGTPTPSKDKSWLSGVR